MIFTPTGNARSEHRLPQPQVQSFSHVCFYSDVIVRYYEHQTCLPPSYDFLWLKGYFWRPLAWPLTRKNTRDRNKIWRSARDAWCIPRFGQWQSHSATFLPAYRVEPSCWKLKLPSAFKAVRAFRTLRQEALKTAVNRFITRLREGNVIPATLLR